MSQSDPLDVGGMIRDAIVAKFFEPTPFVGQWVNPATGMSEQQLMHGAAPMQAVADAIFQRHQKAIIEAVQDTVDINAISDRVATKVSAQIVDKLTVGSGYYSYNPDREALQKLVLEKTAELLAAGQVERLRALEASEVTSA